MPTALQRMQTLSAAWTAGGDRRALFLDAYARMTEAMVGAAAAGEFADRAWVERLVERFAEYYFVAVDGHDGGTTCPLVWREAFDACRREDLNALQLILLGINAHINHDLVLALADVLEDWDGLASEDRARRVADHARVNVVIERTVDAVQTDVLTRALPAMGVVDAALGRVDEWLFTAMVARWRTEVWADAQRLLAARTTAERAAVLEDVHRQACRFGRLVVRF